MAQTLPISAPRSRRRGGFTLIEIVVAATIIVLLIGMALPVFRAITGGRSEEGATNQIASLLARARADAVGLQQPAGVAFVYNPATAVTYMAEVQFRDCQPWSAGITYGPGTYAKVNASPASNSPPVDCFYLAKTASTNSPPPPYSGTGAPAVPYSPTSNGNWQLVSGPPLDIAPDTDLIPLPSGVGVQTVCNCSLDASGVRSSDGYLSVGAILFDGRGHITAQPYEIDSLAVTGNPGRTEALLSKAGLGTTAFPLFKVFAPYRPLTYSNTVPARYGVESQYGLVLYQREAFVNQGFPTGPDPIYTTTTPNTPPSEYKMPAAGGPTQLAAEQWLDLNATPLLIDRNNGTIIRAQ